MSVSELLTQTAAVVGRQPIFDRSLQVAGYELLYRGGTENRASFDSSVEATNYVLSTSFLEFGLDELVGEHDAYVNVCGRFLFEETLDDLPRERIVLEILEDTTVTKELLERVDDLKESGFRIALDDFELTPDNAALVKRADIVKLDLRQLGRDGIARYFERLAPFGMSLLAEKIEAYEDFELCRDLGFEMFQGFFICGPERCEGRATSTDRVRTLAMMAAFNDPEVTPERIEREIGSDPTLACKLLRFVNSSSCGLRRKVDSVRHAATLVGLRRLRTWASLVALGTFSSKPRELMVLANARARTCELLAKARGASNPDSHFTVGLFSLLHAFTDQELESVISPLPLTEDVARAIVAQENEMGDVLGDVIAAERGTADESVADLYVQALNWADEAVAAIADED